MPDASTNPPRIVTCPTCGQRVKWSAGNEFRPFCSERCKLIDRRRWLDEEYGMPFVPENPSEELDFSDDEDDARQP